MAVVVLILIILLILATVTVWPKLVPLLIWPVILLYPNAWWLKISPLPMHIGFDDLFILVGALVVFFRINISQGVPVRVTWPLKLVLAYALMTAVGNFCGSMQFGYVPAMVEAQVREFLKTGIWALLVFSVTQTVQSPADLRRFIKSLTLSLFATAGLVIYTYYRPQVAVYFTSQSEAERLAEGWGGLRATGSLAEANTVGAVMALSVVFVLLMLKMTAGGLRKAFWSAGLLLLLVAQLLSQSRTGLLCTFAIPPVVLFLKGMRKWSVLVLTVGVIFLLTVPHLAGPALERVIGALDPSQASKYGTIDDRAVIWKAHVNSMSPMSWLVGRGEGIAVLQSETGQKPHSGYLNLLSYFGLIGVAWGMWYLWGTVSRIRALLADRGDTVYSTIGRGTVLYVTVLALVSLTMETMSPGNLMIALLFTILAIMDRAVESQQEEAQWEMSYGDEPAEVVQDSVVQGSQD